MTELYPDTEPIDITLHAVNLGYHRARIVLPARDVHPAVYAAAAKCAVVAAKRDVAITARDAAERAVPALEASQAQQAATGEYDVVAGAEAMTKAKALAASWQVVIDGGGISERALWQEYLAVLDDVRDEWGDYLAEAATVNAERVQTSAQVLTDELAHARYLDGFRELLMARGAPDTAGVSSPKPERWLDFHTRSVDEPLANAVSQVLAASSASKRPPEPEAVEDDSDETDIDPTADEIAAEPSEDDDGIKTVVDPAAEEITVEPNDEPDDDDD